MPTSSDDLYKYIGLAVVSLGLFYLVCKSFNIHANAIVGKSSETYGAADVIEGFTGDPKTISSTIKSNTSKIDDPLLVSKNRKGYEEMLIDLDDNMKALLLGAVIHNAETFSDVKNITRSLEDMNKIKTISEFRKVINETMGILNKHP